MQITNTFSLILGNWSPEVVGKFLLHQGQTEPGPGPADMCPTGGRGSYGQAVPYTLLHDFGSCKLSPKEKNFICGMLLL